MARYIDADKLIAHLKDEIEGCKQSFNSRANGKGIAYGTELGLKSAISFANTLAIADVVPKSEVVNILDILIKEAGEIAESYKVRIAELNGLEYADRVKSEYIGTQVGALLVQLRIAQLKKKYTESEGKE